jgi:hypothetical protein
MKEIMEAAAALPAEERAMVAESILRTLDAPDADTDSKWAVVAQRRLGELRSGAVESAPGEAVFEKVWKRFEG